VVAEQFEPDGTFPTVSFPNPEEPGAMDLLMALGAAVGAHVAIANDPDADRLGAAIPQPDGSWRRLGGDEIGWLFADYLLAQTSGDDRLVITTLVSSALLGKMAEGARCALAETFTGFKWIGRTMLDHPDLRFVLGYEQALGYLVADRPLDKDGISMAAVLFAEPPLPECLPVSRSRTWSTSRRRTSCGSPWPAGPACRCDRAARSRR
jgi:phosphomannomutase